MSGSGRLSLWVILPTYNGARYLPEQLESLLQQTRMPDGVVAYDDASADGTADILDAFAETAPFPFLVFRRPTNTGLPKNAEDALTCVPESADVIVFCDQDDAWMTHKLERVEVAFSAPSTLLWFSDADLVDEQGEALGRTLWDAVGLGAGEDLNEPLQLGRMLAGVTVFGAAAAARASLIRVALPVPRTPSLVEPQHFQCDSWFAFVAHLRKGILLDPVPSTRYRQHAGQFTSMGASCASRETSPRSDPAVPLLQANLALVENVIAALSRPGKLAYLGGTIPDMLERRRAFLSHRLQVLRHEALPTILLRPWLRGDYSRFAHGNKTFATDLLRSTRGPKRNRQAE